jgi:hypothetical protein
MQTIWFLWINCLFLLEKFGAILSNYLLNTKKKMFLLFNNYYINFFVIFKKVYKQNGIFRYTLYNKLLGKNFVYLPCKINSLF